MKAFFFFFPNKYQQEDSKISKERQGTKIGGEKKNFEKE